MKCGTLFAYAENDPALHTIFADSAEECCTDIGEYVLQPPPQPPPYLVYIFP